MKVIFGFPEIEDGITRSFKESLCKDIADYLEGSKEFLVINIAGRKALCVIADFDPGSMQEFIKSKMETIPATKKDIVISYDIPDELPLRQRNTLKTIGTEIVVKQVMRLEEDGTLKVIPLSAPAAAPYSARPAAVVRPGGVLELPPLTRPSDTSMTAKKTFLVPVMVSYRTMDETMYYEHKSYVSKKIAIKNPHLHVVDVHGSNLIALVAPQILILQEL